MKLISFLFLVAFIVSGISLHAQEGPEILRQRAEEYKKRRLEDSLRLAEKEKVWDQALVTEAVAQPDGYFTINILNESNENAYIYIDGQYTFTVLKGSKLMDYKARRLRSIYAITYDKSYKWGPIDLTQRKEEDFYWKLNIPEKASFE